MVCLRSTVFERRPDLPLCSMRKIRQLRAERPTGSSRMRDVLTSKGLEQAAQNVGVLLKSPVQASDGMPLQDQIAIGKTIVGRLGKDDHWVTVGTVGCTFAAATREFPEYGVRPVSVERLRKIVKETGGHPVIFLGFLDSFLNEQLGPGVSEGIRFARQRRSASNRRQQLSKAGGGSAERVIKPRELALLKARYRLVVAEHQAEADRRGCTSDPAGDRRFRRINARIRSSEKHHGDDRWGSVKGWAENPRRQQGIISPIGNSEAVIGRCATPAALHPPSEAGNARVGDGLQGDIDEGHISVGDASLRPIDCDDRESGSSERSFELRHAKSAGDQSARRTEAHPARMSDQPGGSYASRLGSDKRRAPGSERAASQSLLSPRPWSASCQDTRQATSPKLACSPRPELTRREEVTRRPHGISGAKLTPQPLSSRTGVRSSGAIGGPGTAVVRQHLTLHRGVAITDHLRQELSNPMSQRFKLLKGR